MVSRDHFSRNGTYEHVSDFLQTLILIGANEN